MRIFCGDGRDHTKMGRASSFAKPRLTFDAIDAVDQLSIAPDVRICETIFEHFGRLGFGICVADGRDHHHDRQRTIGVMETNFVVWQHIGWRAAPPPIAVATPPRKLLIWIPGLHLFLRRREQSATAQLVRKTHLRRQHRKRKAAVRHDPIGGFKVVYR
jgi:hypothetical protein